VRIADIFVATCMVLIAGSAGAVVYFYLGGSVSEAVTVAVAILTGLALYNIMSTRYGLRTAAGHQIADLSRGAADLARQVAELGRRLAAMENRVDAAVDRTQTAIDRTQAATDPLTAEIGELGTLVKQLAETVAAHEMRLIELSKRPVAPASAFIAPDPVAVAPAVPPATPVTLAPPLTAAAPVAPAAPLPPSVPELKPAVVDPVQAPEPEAEKLSDIRSAIEANRVDLYLQPIVTLPQRKVRYYEAMSRLRTERGDVLHAADFIPQAESSGLMPKIDNLVVFRCVQVVRRLLLKNRDIGLFCNVAGSTLTDATVFAQLVEFLDANRAIAPSLVLEFTQSAVRAMGPIEHESLAALAERGFRFSLDNVADLRFEPRELADRSFRFIKIPASLLLNRTGTAATDIHPADLSDLLGRFGIDLVADKIEGEGSVVDLLDYDVHYGQGFLFSAPRPVRAEALQGIAERSDVVARDLAAPEDRAAAPNAVGRSADAATPSPEPAKPERTTGLAQLARGLVSRG
jgi:cyclic-di-GMP phosphodiesterase, flagellum assembly factor TipF